jgi:hypothetical protein
MRSLQGLISVLALLLVVTAALGQRSTTLTDDILAADTEWRRAYAAKDLDKTMTLVVRQFGESDTTANGSMKPGGLSYTYDLREACSSFQSVCWLTSRKSKISR